MRESRAEEGTVDVNRAELRNVDLFAPRTVNFESGHLKAVTETNWQNLLAIAQSSWAVTIESSKELMVNLGKSDWAIDKTRMDKTVKVTCLLIELKELFVSKVLFIWALRRKDHLNALLKLFLAHGAIKTVQIEMVADKNFFNLDHVFVALK